MKGDCELHCVNGFEVGRVFIVQQCHFVDGRARGVAFLVGILSGLKKRPPEGICRKCTFLQIPSNEGDLAADNSAGSDTTAAVAEKLERTWIAVDRGKFGIHLTRKRLIGVHCELKAAGKDFRAFEVLKLGRYERQAYLNVGGRLTGGIESAIPRTKGE